MLAVWQPWILPVAGPSVGSADTVQGRRDYRRRHCDALGILREPFKRWIDRHDGNEPTGDSATKPPKPSRFVPLHIALPRTRKAASGRPPGMPLVSPTTIPRPPTTFRAAWPTDVCSRSSFLRRRALNPPAPVSVITALRVHLREADVFCR